MAFCAFQPKRPDTHDAAGHVEHTRDAATHAVGLPAAGVELDGFVVNRLDQAGAEHGRGDALDHDGGFGRHLFEGLRVDGVGLQQDAAQRRQIVELAVHQAAEAGDAGLAGAADAARRVAGRAGTVVEDRAQAAVGCLHGD